MSIMGFMGIAGITALASSKIKKRLHAYVNSVELKLNIYSYHGDEEFYYRP